MVTLKVCWLLFVNYESAIRISQWRRIIVVISLALNLIPSDILNSSFFPLMHKLPRLKPLEVNSTVTYGIFECVFSNLRATW